MAASDNEAYILNISWYIIKVQYICTPKYKIETAPQYYMQWPMVDVEIFKNTPVTFGDNFKR